MEECRRAKNEAVEVRKTLSFVVVASAFSLFWAEKRAKADVPAKVR